MMIAEPYAHNLLTSQGMSEQNAERVIAWWFKSERAGRPPDIRRHLIQLRAGVAFPVERLTPPRLRLRTTGEPRMPASTHTREQSRC